MNAKIAQPLYETPGGIAGGGSGGGPASGSGGTPSNSGGSGISGGGAAPQHVDISHDSFVKVPGSDKPVKFGDYIGGYVSKADFTRAQQKAAAEAAQYKAALQEQETKFREAASRIMGRIGGGQQAQGSDPNDLGTMLTQLESREYVDGRTAAGLIRNLVQSSVMPLAQAIKQRDAALTLMAKRLQALDGTVGTLRSRTSEGDFHSKLSTARQNLGLPDDPAVNELLQDVYLSHEGPDLDQEFPNLVKSRFDGIRNLVRALDRKEAEDAKKQRLGIPGKGGNAQPGRPLRKGFQTPQQIADELWAGLGGIDT